MTSQKSRIFTDLGNGTEGDMMQHIPEYDVPHLLQPVLVLVQGHHHHHAPSTLTEAINSSILKINIGSAMGGGGLEINNCNLKQEQLFCKLYSNFLIDTELFIVKK